MRLNEFDVDAEQHHHENERGVERVSEERRNSAAAVGTAFTLAKIKIAMGGLAKRRAICATSSACFFRAIGER